MALSAEHSLNNPRVGIFFILVAVVCISVNDMLIKLLSGGYPLHQMVFVRSAIGIVFSVIVLSFEGGFALLRTDRVGLHVLRCLSIVFANMAFFVALAVIPLATATALFFVAPLFITLLSIPLLGEPVGIRRLSAVAVGFLGVLVMLGSPETADPVAGEAPSRWIYLLPVLGAFGYAMMQILTRRLGGRSPASAMAIYVQGMFLLVSIGFWFVAGDGRYADGAEDPSWIFLFRAWVFPPAEDLVLFLVLGFVSAIIAYSLSQAYRSAAAATVAPFEYVELPFAIFWGWAIFGHWPALQVFAGAALIAGAGVFVFLREAQKTREGARQEASRAPLRRN